ncbi:MAG TPA: hypothetical protein VMX54_08500 [Vicinamibacteria bacterium]|nr:hypothetical protein [Vicinamibacteria bacterium]
MVKKTKNNTHDQMVTTALALAQEIHEVLADRFAERPMKDMVLALVALTALVAHRAGMPEDALAEGVKTFYALGHPSQGRALRQGAAEKIIADASDPAVVAAEKAAKRMSDSATKRGA